MTPTIYSYVKFFVPVDICVFFRVSPSSSFQRPGVRLDLTKLELFMLFSDLIYQDPLSLSLNVP